MRKKYLSALLFGALLFASAGTFTSCKDYDDDIKDLQEQVNTIRTDLDNLKSTVEGLDGVKTLKYENNQLVIETGKGTKVEVDIPTGTQVEGVTEVKLVGNVLYVDGKEMGKVEIPEAGTLKVEVKGGKLYINDKVQDLEVGNKVVMVDNGDGTYTMTIDGTSYVLPKASAAVSLKITSKATDNGTYFFTNLSQNTTGNEENVAETGGILWGTADSYKGNWKGLKSVEKGKLLVGQIKSLEVSVSPATFDLNTVQLSLVNTLGETAPVLVKAVAKGSEGPLVSGSRAADANGQWVLDVEMNNTITAENIANAFAKRLTPAVSKNIKYALAVDGKVVTDYNIYVDTDIEKANPAKGNLSSFDNLVVKYNKKGQEFNITASTLPLGSTELYIDPRTDNTDADKIYDSYIEIVDIDEAKTYGIEVNGMTITASHSAGDLKDFHIKIHVMDVNGNETISNPFKLSFAQSTESGSEIGVQTYKVMPTTSQYGAYVLVDLGDTFTSLSSEDAHKISNMTEADGAVKWYTTIDTKTFYTSNNVTEDKLVEIISRQSRPANKIHYYASKEDAIKDAMSGQEVDNDGNNLSIVVENGQASTIKTIRFAAIPISFFSEEATPGANDITIIMSGTKDSRVNEIKRATTTLTIQAPTFDDVLEINKEQNLWKDDTYSVRMNGEQKISMLKPFISKGNAAGDKFFDTNAADGKLSYELRYTDFDKKVQIVNINNTELKELAGTVIKDHNLIDDINVTATLKPFDGLENFNTTKTFKLNVKSVFEDAQLVYYVAGKAQDVITLGNNQYIEPGYIKNNQKEGLYVKFDGEEYSYAFAEDEAFPLPKFNNGVVVEPSVVVDNESSSYNAPKYESLHVKPNIYLGEGATGSIPKIKPVAGASNSGKESVNVLLFNGVSEGTKGTVVFNFMDANGVKYPVSLKYQK